MKSISAKTTVSSHELPFKAVRLEVQSNQTDSPRLASGFIRKEGEDHYLYTSWHVVTGYDPHHVEEKEAIRRPKMLVHLQDAHLQPGFERIGGHQSIELDLLDESVCPARPRWMQDPQHVPHFALNCLGLRVPFWHDAVKIKLPATVNLSVLQVIPEDAAVQGGEFPQHGQKTVLVGYPFGYSVSGMEQPTPVVLTRYVAGLRPPGFSMEFLLDGIGAPSMSGCPVFVMGENKNYLLAGMYVGCIFPDHAQRLPKERDTATALGRVCSLSDVLGKYGLTMDMHDAPTVSDCGWHHVNGQRQAPTNA